MGPFLNRLLSSAVGGAAAFGIVVLSAFLMLAVAGQVEALGRFLSVGWIAAALATILVLPFAVRLGRVSIRVYAIILVAAIAIYVLRVPFYASSANQMFRVVRYLIFFVHLPLCVAFGAVSGGYAERGLRNA